MTELPHVFLVAEARVWGEPCRGLASEGLPPKWFTKDPDTRFEDDLPAMLEVIRHAAKEIRGKEFESVFEAWRLLYRAQDGWSAERGH
ncbi:MAG: hypothetical protein GWO24_34765, partial [Akkermansiaceae bacterium]|nr:hypothetical protein [Akkermansiaceae bacterium]